MTPNHTVEQPPQPLQCTRCARTCTVSHTFQGMFSFHLHNTPLSKAVSSSPTHTQASNRIAGTKAARKPEEGRLLACLPERTLSCCGLSNEQSPHMPLHSRRDKGICFYGLPPLTRVRFSYACWQSLRIQLSARSTLFYFRSFIL